MAILEPVIRKCDGVLDSDGQVLTEEFLYTCDHVLPFIDQLGTGLMIVRADVQSNIERLRAKWKSDPEAYRTVTSIAIAEKNRGEHTGSKSCAKGLLWLTRGMVFIVTLLRLTAADSSKSFSDAVREAYALVLKPYHGIFSSAAFAIAIKFVPSRRDFLARLGDDDSVVLQQVNEFVEKFGGIMAVLHQWLDSNGLNDPEKV